MKHNLRKTPTPLLLFGLTVLLAACSRFAAPIGIQSVPRDAFPVFDNPELVSAAEADQEGLVRDDDPVIGISLDDAAKAFPIDIMGVHELGNDYIGDIPIAVTW